VETAAARTDPLQLKAEAVPGLPRPGWFGALSGSTGVKEMSIGMEHGAFVTHGGELFCVGGNEWGQCGVMPPRQKGPMGALENRSRMEVEFPVKVCFPETAGPIVSVEVGGRHTIASDSTGRRYAFGDDRRIQLGLGDTRTGGSDERHSYGVIHSDALGGKQVKADMKRAVTYRYYDPHMQSTPVETVSPEVQNRPPYPPAAFLACGEDFTIAVHRDSPDWYADKDETNVLLCCGENGTGQCGRTLAQQQQAWLPVRFPKHIRTKQLSAGQSHCLALLQNGQVYAWGANSQGQVGNGKRSLVPKPMQVTLEPRLPAASSASRESLQNEPDTVTAHDIYKRAMYRHATARGKTSEEVPAPPKVDKFPGTVTSISCGFRSSAVICEVPQQP